jgi:small nuclear ribonucleoprotein (snRNP)-like protein
MSVRIISRRLDAREVTIKLVDGSMVKGKINMFHDEGMVQRVSDIFTKVEDPFIVVFDATVEGKTGKVCIVNKRNIVWVSPDDTPQPT